MKNNKPKVTVVDLEVFKKLEKRVKELEHYQASQSKVLRLHEDIMEKLQEAIRLVGLRR